MQKLYLSDGLGGSACNMGIILESTGHCMKMLSCHVAYTGSLVCAEETLLVWILPRNKTFRSLEKRNATFMSMPGVLADLLRRYSRITSSQALERHG